MIVLFVEDLGEDILYIPLIADDLLEAVEHAIVRVDATSLACLKLPVLVISPVPWFG